MAEVGRVEGFFVILGEQQEAGEAGVGRRAVGMLLHVGCMQDGVRLVKAGNGLSSGVWWLR